MGEIWPKECVNTGRRGKESYRDVQGRGCERPDDEGAQVPILSGERRRGERGHTSMPSGVGWHVGALSTENSGADALRVLGQCAAGFGCDRAGAQVERGVAATCDKEKSQG